MDLLTEPGFIYSNCFEPDCNVTVQIPVYFEAILVHAEDGSRPIMAKVSAIDMQPAYDHRFTAHGPSL